MRFGIIGCGMISAFHINAIRTLDNAELIGLVDSDFGRADALAKRYGATAYASYDMMLSDPRIDTVCICTPSWLHAVNARDALRKGKNVILEKPMALNMSDARMLAEECGASGKKLTVISQLLYEPDVQKAKKIIESGELGRIVMVDLSMKYYRSPEYYSESPWRGKLKMDGGGALINQGIHGVSLMQYLVGRTKNASGKIRTLVHDIEAEDTAAAILEFENGALGVITATTSAFPGCERRLSISGEKGSLVMKENAIESIVTKSGKYGDLIDDPADVLSGSNEPMNIDNIGHIRQIRNFIAACEGKEYLLFGVEEGMESLRLILEIYGSSENK